jgi:ribosomal-protein-serine acetyltransferase
MANLFMTDYDPCSIDELTQTFFSVFDNRRGKVPDLSCLDQMFVEPAIITKREGDHLEIMSLAEFVAPRQDLLTSGALVEFHEWEVEAQTFVDGGIATRICKYMKEGLLNGEPFSGVGMKSIQFVRTGRGWRITSVLWEDIEPGVDHLDQDCQGE